MMSKLRRCWDADSCFGYLSNQGDHQQECARVLTSAEEGNCEIVVSALALAEVLYLKGDGSTKLFKESRDKIREFFRRSCFVVVDVDRFVAEQAQELFWTHNGPNGLMPKDAVHLATALQTNSTYLETFDGCLLGLSSKVGGNPALLVQRPGHDLVTPLTGGVEPDGQMRFDATQNDE